MLKDLDMKQRFLYMVLALCMFSIQSNAQSKPVPEDSREQKVGRDGFEWYRVCKNGKYGAEDKDGNVLVPCEFERVRYRSFDKMDSSYLGAGFETKVGTSFGRYSFDGKCIIPITRGYIQIYEFTLEDKPEIGTYYECRYDSGVALCYANGEEVRRFDGYYAAVPRYAKGKFCYMICKDRKFGVMDGEGRIIIEPTYSSLDVDKDGNFMVYGNTRDVPPKKVGDVSSVTTTRNPFANNPLTIQRPPTATAKPEP